MQCPFPYDVSEICHEIQNLLGNKKIVECILVDIEFKCEPCVIKSLMCSSNWIDNNYSSKPWKRSYHFALFIKPKEIDQFYLKNTVLTGYVSVLLPYFIVLMILASI